MSVQKSPVLRSQLRPGLAKALWAATLSIRKHFGYPWVDDCSSAAVPVAQHPLRTLEFPLLRRCDREGRSGDGAGVLQDAGIGGVPSVTVVDAWHTKVVQWCRSSTSAAFAAAVDSLKVNPSERVPDLLPRYVYYRGE